MALSYPILGSGMFASNNNAFQLYINYDVMVNHVFLQTILCFLACIYITVSWLVVLYGVYFTIYLFYIPNISALSHGLHQRNDIAFYSCSSVLM